MAEPLILLVNDIPDHARAYESVLRRNGYRVQLVYTASAALQAARAEPPACTVIDVRLPDVTGWTLCRAIKADASIAITPIVMPSLPRRAPGRRPDRAASAPAPARRGRR